MFSFTAIFGSLISLLSTFAFIRYFLICEFKLNKSNYKEIFDKIRSVNKFTAFEEIVDSKSYPLFYRSLIFHPRVWFYLDIAPDGNARWDSTAILIKVKCLRWNKDKLIKLFSTEKTKSVPVQLVYWFGTNSIGKINHESPCPKQEERIWKDIEEEVKLIDEGKKNKTGILLYGPPGNGKTTFIKYLAFKYKFPINIITLSPDMTNDSVMLNFAQIEPHSIVLLEDFDSIWNGRKMVTENKEQKLSFDVILNCLDGIFNAYEQNIFIMTVNDLDKVDSALKDRPSRFKFVREFNSTNLDIKIPEDWKQSNLNLDQLLRLQEYHKLGLSKEDSYFRLNLEVK